ncbi:DUF922 domain-containing protein [Antarcticibacterium flavum]|uniref:DUF922 domain-containing protein n=1 Tax=Antarcticibacterium flavum TaxID=2058175 RepID=A0A5B7X712_9FLAO|nr:MULTISPECIES: DUF922 domain-containing protein [Antarcticibacterium]MCM4159634.1 DUF922 domain-containing protein [Antarcticibacterium sp. W02-3]QCY70880.1 DUF922 domain-containing protein [Antarcticibacterium flavum]
MRTIIFLFLLAGQGLHAQNNPEKIYWQDEPLSWEDFKARPDKSSSFQANTNAGLSYSWNLKNENGILSLRYEVFSYFNPESSWVVPTSKNDHLLTHEQLHFDITELHARKLRKELSNLQIEQLGKDPKRVLNSFYSRIEKERAVMQQKFDRETNHSMNREAEAKWQKFVKDELAKVKDYQA